MKSLFYYLKDRVSGKAPKGAKRSSGWSNVRREHIKKQPTCQLCGGSTKLQVHHKIPFHLAPALELHPDNLVTLCEDRKWGFKCHQFVGHLGNFQCVNISIDQHILFIKSMLDEGRSQTKALQESKDKVQPLVAKVAEGIRDNNLPMDSSINSEILKRQEATETRDEEPTSDKE